MEKRNLYHNISNWYLLALSCQNANYIVLYTLSLLVWIEFNIVKMYTLTILILKDHGLVVVLEGGGINWANKLVPWTTKDQSNNSLCQSINSHENENNLIHAFIIPPLPLSRFCY